MHEARPTVAEPTSTSRTARRPRRRDVLTLIVTTIIAAARPGIAVALPELPVAPVPIGISVSGANGEGRIEAPGRSCADGGAGAYWNYDYDAPISAGDFSGLPGELTLHLALHSDIVRHPNTGPRLSTTGPRAFLQGEDSYAVLANDRGTVKVRLQSGTCESPTLQFDGSSGAGAGTWAVAGGQGAYRDVAGSGSFTVAADVNPGADNPFALDLQGTLDVLQPSLDVQVVGAFWGSLGLDYLTRRVTVLYQVTNSGPGDAFDARLASTVPTAPGVAVLGSQSSQLGDLEAGDSEVRAVRFQLGLLQPCQLIILSCTFDATTTVSWSDALDVVSTPSATTQATAPDLPPPL